MSGEDYTIIRRHASGRRCNFPEAGARIADYKFMQLVSAADYFAATITGTAMCEAYRPER